MALLSAQDRDDRECNALEASRQLNLLCDPKSESRALVDFSSDTLEQKEHKTLEEARHHIVI